jgi:hypothetical protein
MRAAIQEMKPKQGMEGIYLMSHVVKGLSSDPQKREEFLQEMRQVQDDSFRQSGLTTLMSQWSESDPEAAARYLEGMEPGSEDYKVMEEAVLANWDDEDPIAAITWKLDRLEENVPAGDQIAKMFGAWASDEPDRAIEWLDSQPSEVRTDSLYKSTASRLAGTAPQTANQLITRIEDPTQRQRALISMEFNYRTMGQDKLNEWIEGLPLSLRAEYDAMKSEP